MIKTENVSLMKFDLWASKGELGKEIDRQILCIVDPLLVFILKDSLGIMQITSPMSRSSLSLSLTCCNGERRTVRVSR